MRLQASVCVCVEVCVCVSTYILYDICPFVKRSDWAVYSDCNAVEKVLLLLLLLLLLSLLLLLLLLLLLYFTIETKQEIIKIF